MILFTVIIFYQKKGVCQGDHLVPVLLSIIIHDSAFISWFYDKTVKDLICMFKGLHEDNDNKVILHGKIHWCNIYKYKHCKSHFNMTWFQMILASPYTCTCKRSNSNFNLEYTSDRLLWKWTIRKTLRNLAHTLYSWVSSL